MGSAGDVAALAECVAERRRQRQTAIAVDAAVVLPDEHVGASILPRPLGACLTRKARGQPLPCGQYCRRHSPKSTNVPHLPPVTTTVTLPRVLLTSPRRQHRAEPGTGGVRRRAPGLTSLPRRLEQRHLARRVGSGGRSRRARSIVGWRGVQRPLDPDAVAGAALAEPDQLAAVEQTLRRDRARRSRPGRTTASSPSTRRARSVGGLRRRTAAAPAATSRRPRSSNRERRRARPPGGATMSTHTN